MSRTIHVSTRPLAPSLPVREWLLLLVLAVLPYLNALNNDLVYDDRALITENPAVHSLTTAVVQPGLGRFTVEWYRPLTMLSLAVGYQFGGESPFGHHLVNLLLHAVNAILTFHVALALLGHRVAALSAAALFAVHAVHVEAVTPIAGRADLLATAGALAAWRLALPAGRIPSWPRCLAIASLTLLASLAKESAIITGGLIALTDLVAGTAASRSLGAGPLARRWRLHLANAGAVVVVLTLRYAATGGAFAVDGSAARAIENPLAAATPIVRVLTALWVLCRYLGLLLVPYPLTADYSFAEITPIDSWGDPRLGGVILIAAVGAAMLADWRRHRVLVGLAAAVLVAWLPVSNVVIPIGTVMGERLVYLPSAPFAILIVGMAMPMASIGRLRRLAMAVFASVLLMHTAVAIRRNRDWRSQLSLFESTVRHSPRSAKAHFNYGVELHRQGRPTEALSHLNTALGIADPYPEAHNAVGVVMLDARRDDEAEHQFREAVREAPALARGWLNLGTTLFRTARDSEAQSALEQAVALDPQLPLAHATLGALAERRGDLAAAVSYYRAALRLAPAFPGLADRFATLTGSTSR